MPPSLTIAWMQAVLVFSIPAVGDSFPLYLLEGRVPEQGPLFREAHMFRMLQIEGGRREIRHCYEVVLLPQNSYVALLASCRRPNSLSSLSPSPPRSFHLGALSGVIHYYLYSLHIRSLKLHDLMTGILR